MIESVLQVNEFTMKSLRKDMEFENNQKITEIQEPEASVRYRIRIYNREFSE